MSQDRRLQAEEQIMEAVCDLCHWPYKYRADGVDEETMWAEKCEICAAARRVKEVLREVAP